MAIWFAGSRIVAVLSSFTILTAEPRPRFIVTWAIVPIADPVVTRVPLTGDPIIVGVMIAGLVAVCVAAVITAVVAVTYAQPPPDAAASTAAASVTRHGRVTRDPKPAGEGEQHEVSERVQDLFRPAATGPIRAEDPASGSTRWPVRLHVCRAALLATSAASTSADSAGTCANRVQRR